MMAAVMFQGPPFLKGKGSLGSHSIILDPSLHYLKFSNGGPDDPLFAKMGALKQNRVHHLQIWNNAYVVGVIFLSGQVLQNFLTCVAFFKNLRQYRALDPSLVIWPTLCNEN